jgi:hypothetical protein
VKKGKWIQGVNEDIAKKHTQGKFTTKALRHQMLPIAYAKQVLKNPGRHTKATVKEAQFIKNVNPGAF